MYKLIQNHHYKWSVFFYYFAMFETFLDIKLLLPPNNRVHSVKSGLVA